MPAADARSTRGMCMPMPAAVKVSALERHSIHCAVAAAAQVDVSKGEHLQESYAEIHPSQLTPALGAFVC